MRITSIFFIIIGFAFGCKNAKQPSSEDSEVDNSVISSQGSWKSVKNETADYILYYEVKEDVKNPKTEQKFYVTDVTGNKIFESEVYGGYVKWYDATKVEYFSPPGVMPSNMEKDDFIMIYDIVEDKAFKKSNLKQ